MNNPIVLLSPSKGMGSFPSNAPYVGSAAVPFAAATHEVVMRIQALSADQRQHLFKVSDNLFQSVERIWSLSPSEYIKPSQGLSGLFAYTGEAFKSFDAHSLGHNALQRAKKSLVIVSALYGIVTGEMNIVNYRLEMQSKLPINGYKNLYSLWKPILTEWLNNQESSFAVNLCSTEYSKVFEWKSIEQFSPSIPIESTIVDEPIEPVIKSSDIEVLDLRLRILQVIESIFKIVLG